ncbi:MAG TPA: penicillin-binding protein activator [Alphaproteobacteria bacterium]|nr:penicillin-binding protein activator [Alphaproteobacteria bacterium]
MLATTLAACETKVQAPVQPVQVPPVTEPPRPLPPPTADVEVEPAPPSGPVPPMQEGVRVAFLAPLSGPNAALGRALLDAAQLAVFEVGDDQLVLLPRDTRGTPEGAAAAAESVIAAGARLIVGPLFAADVPAVAARARPAGVSVLSFSNDLSVAGPGVFVMGVPPRAQIDRVISFARSRGLSRYAGLLPNNSYGAAVESALRAATERVGGQLTVIERYDPATTDASPVVRRLASYEARRANLQQQRRELEGREDEASKQALRRLEGIDTLGEVRFDSLVLPDFGDRLLSIAPLLPYYDIDPNRIRLLGTSLWDDMRVTREPALIGGWFAAPPPEAREPFNKRYREVYRREPPRLATIAYDATALAAVLARNEGGPDFSIEAITNPVGFAGMDGVFRLLPDGSIERALAVMEVQRARFRTISPAPETFEEQTQ